MILVDVALADLDDVAVRIGDPDRAPAGDEGVEVHRAGRDFASAPISASFASTSSTMNARCRQPGYSGPGPLGRRRRTGGRRLEQLQVERPGLQEHDLVAAAERATRARRNPKCFV